MGFRQQLWRKFSKLTELYHITTENTMSFPAEFLKQWKIEQKKISFLAPKVSALVPEKIKKCSCLEAFKSKSGNGNQIVHVGYAKLFCNMLVFFKCAHVYTSIQMHILSIYARNLRLQWRLIFANVIRCSSLRFE